MARTRVGTGSSKKAKAAHPSGIRPGWTAGKGRSASIPTNVTLSNPERPVNSEPEPTAVKTTAPTGGVTYGGYILDSEGELEHEEHDDTNVSSDVEFVEFIDPFEPRGTANKENKALTERGTDEVSLYILVLTIIV